MATAWRENASARRSEAGESPSVAFHSKTGRRRSAGDSGREASIGLVLFAVVVFLSRSSRPACSVEGEDQPRELDLALYRIAGRPILGIQPEAEASPIGPAREGRSYGPTGSKWAAESL